MSPSLLPFPLLMSSERMAPSSLRGPTAAYASERVR